jgi:nucleotidyltransferase substrate binding protein (TIGR01987 family)
MKQTTILDLSSLVNALNSLSEAVSEMKKQVDNKFIRDATIQRFEYSYELAHKMLKRYLEMTESSAEEVDQMSFQNLIRTGAERGLLLNSWDIWSVYRNARNLTSHTYNEAKAVEVCLVIPDFLHDATYLLDQLQARATGK